MFYYLLLLHYISDFLLQDRKMAEHKSKDWRIMFLHCFFIWAVFLLANNVFLATIYACIHYLQDTFIWKFYKRNKSMSFEYWKDSLFYSTIGLDQILHISTIYFLWRSWGGLRG